MTPQEHYETAEEYLDDALRVLAEPDAGATTRESVRLIIASAQVHATLATAAPSQMILSDTAVASSGGIRWTRQDVTP